MTDIAMIEAAARAGRGRGAGNAAAVFPPSSDEIAGRPVFAKAEGVCSTPAASSSAAAGRRSRRWTRPRAPKGQLIAYSSPQTTLRAGARPRQALHGVPSVIIMPRDAPALKIENTRALGAEVVLYDRGAGGERKREAIGARAGGRAGA